MPNRCEDCSALWGDDVSLGWISHLTERVDPGEPMPVGECPDCGALCHYEEPAKPEKQGATE